MSTPPKLDDDSCGSQRTFSSKSFVRKSFDEVQKEKASHQKAACDVTASENQHARRRRTFELMRHSDLGGTQRLLKGALDQHLTPKEKMDTVLTRGKQQGWNAAKFFRFFDANDDGTLSKTDFVEGFQCLDPHVHFDDSDLNEIIGLFQTHDNGKIHMKEFEDYCYTLPDPSWKAEKLRRTCVAALDHLSSAVSSVSFFFFLVISFHRLLSSGVPPLTNKQNHLEKTKKPKTRRSRTPRSKES